MKPSKIAKAEYRSPKRVINIELQLLTWEDENIHYVYSPALDLTGYGNTEKEATDSFNIMLREFVAYADTKDTILDELERLGWTINRKKRRARPPEINELLEDNETFRELRNNPAVKDKLTELDLAL